MSDKAKKGQEVNGPNTQPRKKSQKKGFLQEIEGLFSDLEIEQIPEPKPKEITIQEPPLPSQTPAPMGESIKQATASKDLKPAEPPSQETIPSIALGTSASKRTQGAQPTIQIISSKDGNEQISQASSTLTPIAWESLNLGHPIAESTQKEQPAKLAYARRLGGTTSRNISGTRELQEEKSGVIVGDESRISQTLLLEILDRDPDRSWSEDEVTLVEQVTDQLSLALESARLFQESRTRAEQLAILNEMSRRLSTQLDVDEVLMTIYDYTSRLIDSTNFYVAFHEQETNHLTFPLAVEDNQRVEILTRSLGEELIDQVILTQQPVLLDNPLQDGEKDRNIPQATNSSGSSFDEIKDSVVPDLFDSTQHEKEFSGDERQPLSWLGVPMIYGEKVIGAIAVQSFTRPFLYDQSHYDLLIAIASQSVVAIQNARLFEQTQSALIALEVSERYQKGVAEAVSLLTERGITALSDVLEILGKSALTSRVCYIETQVDQHGPYWRLIAEWRSENTSSQFDNPELRHFSKNWLLSRLDKLRQEGFLSTTLNTASPEEKEILDSLGTRSVLFVAVPGRHEIPGWISFEQTDHDRAWETDEVAALQAAASSLANTLAREDLFTQVQLNLSETEAMYQASAHLNSATNYQEILNVLRQHSILGHTNASNITLHLFEKPWIGWPDTNDKPEWLIPIAYWEVFIDTVGSEDQNQINSRNQISLTSWKASDRFLHPERPMVVHDIDTDPRFADSGRRMYPGLLDAKSMIAIPLNVTGRWIGEIIAIYHQTTGFSEQEMRRLTSLTGQAAVAIESLRLLDETRQRNEELAIINQIISAASQSLELHPVLTEILKQILSAIDFESGLFSIFDTTSKQLRLAVHENMPEGMIKRLIEKGMAGTACDLVFQSGDTIHVPDIHDLPDELRSWQGAFDGLKSAGFASYLGVPLKSKGQILGTICTFNQSLKPVNPLRLSLVETIGQQIGVVVDNAQAYELSQKAVVEISEADRLKTQFLANMSHELRTPLNSIIGFSRVILKGIDGPVNELQTQDLTAIYNSGQHLLGLINDVLDLSKIEAGKMELDFEDEVDLAEIIKSVMSTITGLVQDKPIDLVVEIDPDIPRITIDPMKIRQVLLNLLSNAVKFTEKGSITVGAKSQIGPDDQPEVIVRVIDTGPGIAPEDQAKLFLPFSQVDGSPSRRTGGSGLGLSICQALVQLHNGRIGVESEMDRGSNFFFTLPINQPELPEKELLESNIQSPESGALPQALSLKYSTLHPDNLADQVEEANNMEDDATSTQSSQVMILSIDPDPLVIQMYRRYLEDPNCTVVALTDLELSMEEARKLQPFAITLDVAMKSTSTGLESYSQDGWSILEALKSDPDTEHIPIIICSMQTDQEKAFRMGAADYLVKPILKEDLAQAIYNLRSRL